MTKIIKERGKGMRILETYENKRDNKRERERKENNIERKRK